MRPGRDGADLVDDLLCGSRPLPLDRLTIAVPAFDERLNLPVESLHRSERRNAKILVNNPLVSYG